MSLKPFWFEEIVFGSYLVYSPRGKSKTSKDSQEVRNRVKKGLPDVYQNVAAHLEKNFHNTQLDSVLGKDVILIPAPRSAPMKTLDTLWPAKKTCEALIRCGLGKRVVPCLHRVKAVPKASMAYLGYDRPSLQAHIDSMKYSPDKNHWISPKETRVTIVDDIVTKGTMLFACSCLVGEKLPQTKIFGFAIIRTMGLIPDVEKIVEPCVGKIFLSGEDADRKDS